MSTLKKNRTNAAIPTLIRNCGRSDRAVVVLQVSRTIIAAQTAIAVKPKAGMKPSVKPI